MRENATLYLSWFGTFKWYYMCISGHYCEFAVYVPTECESGTYMPYGDDGSGNVLGMVNSNNT